MLLDYRLWENSRKTWDSKLRGTRQTIVLTGQNNASRLFTWRGAKRNVTMKASDQLVAAAMLAARSFTSGPNSSPADKSVITAEVIADQL